MGLARKLKVFITQKAQKQKGSPFFERFLRPGQKELGGDGKPRKLLIIRTTVSRRGWSLFKEQHEKSIGDIDLVRLNRSIPLSLRKKLKRAQFDIVVFDGTRNPVVIGRLLEVAKEANKGTHTIVLADHRLDKKDPDMQKIMETADICVKRPSIFKPLTLKTITNLLDKYAETNPKELFEAEKARSEDEKKRLEAEKERAEAGKLGYIFFTTERGVTKKKAVDECVRHIKTFNKADEKYIRKLVKTVIREAKNMNTMPAWRAENNHVHFYGIGPSFTSGVILGFIGKGEYAGPGCIYCSLPPYKVKKDSPSTNEV